MSPVTLLTGSPGGGKTTHCRRMMFVEGIAGLICPACELRPGERYGIDALCFRRDNTTERFPLARVRSSEITTRPLKYAIVSPPADDDFPTPRENDSVVKLGPYHFSCSALERCNRFLEGLLSAADRPQLVIVDEIGPLEMNARHGLLPALVTLLGSSVALLLVVRPALVVRLSAFARTIRQDAPIETITTADIPNPQDRRILNFLS